MGVPTSEVGYTPAMPRREDHEVHKGQVVALGGGGVEHRSQKRLDEFEPKIVCGTNPFEA